MGGFGGSSHTEPEKVRLEPYRDSDSMHLREFIGVWADLCGARHRLRTGKEQHVLNK